MRIWVVFAGLFLVQGLAFGQGMVSVHKDEDDVDPAIFDSLKVDITIMHDQNVSTFKQYKSANRNQPLDYTEFAGKDNKNVRTFMVYFHKLTYKPGFQPQMKYFTLKYFDKDNKLLVKETIPVLPNTQVPKIWSGKSSNQKVPVKNAEYAILSVRTKVPESRFYHDVEYRVNLK